MDNQLFNKEAINIWKKAASETARENLDLELTLNQRLLKFFQVGNSFYWVFNLQDFCFDKVSPDVKTILGYNADEFSFDILMQNVHPEDRPSFLNFESKTVEFLAGLPVNKLVKYKVRHDFRVKRKDGAYIRLLHQAIIIEHDEAGRVLRTLGLETDITHLKPEGVPMLSFIGLDDEPSYINVDVEQVFTASKEFLSRRERQILSLIMEGKVSKEISQILHISKQTVDSHRNNMIERNGLKNTSELIATAIRQGWI